jgi:hypothetical protein
MRGYADSCLRWCVETLALSIADRVSSSVSFVAGSLTADLALERSSPESRWLSSAMKPSIICCRCSDLMPPTEPSLLRGWTASQVCLLFAWWCFDAELWWTDHSAIAVFESFKTPALVDLGRHDFNNLRRLLDRYARTYGVSFSIAFSV